MSTAELGISLAEMIRQDKVAIISCTGANLEDIMNLVAHNHYKRVPNYRDLSPQEEWDLLENHYNRVTDTCIPWRRSIPSFAKHIFKVWNDADKKGNVIFLMNICTRCSCPEILSSTTKLIRRIPGCLQPRRKPAYCGAGLGRFDYGKYFRFLCDQNEMKATTMKSGIEYMVWLADWYRKQRRKRVGFSRSAEVSPATSPFVWFRWCTRISEWHDVPFWSYFCQISDSTTSYGSIPVLCPMKKLPGKTWYRYTQIYRGEWCFNRSTAYVCVDIGAVKFVEKQASCFNHEACFFISNYSLTNFLVVVNFSFLHLQQIHTWIPFIGR